jgi:hypothetical protein
LNECYPKYFQKDKIFRESRFQAYQISSVRHLLAFNMISSFWFSHSQAVWMRCRQNQENYDKRFDIIWISISISIWIWISIWILIGRSREYHRSTIWAGYSDMDSTSRRNNKWIISTKIFRDDMQQCGASITRGWVDSFIWHHQWEWCEVTRIRQKNISWSSSNFSRRSHQILERI